MKDSERGELAGEVDGEQAETGVMNNGGGASATAYREQWQVCR